MGKLDQTVLKFGAAHSTHSNSPPECEALRLPPSPTHPPPSGETINHAATPFPPLMPSLLRETAVGTPPGAVEEGVLGLAAGDGRRCGPTSSSMWVVRCQRPTGVEAAASMVR
jgi:hypothetical protein